MSPSDLYIASQKYMFDVFDHVPDFLTVFSWLPISFAPRFTLRRKASYVRIFPSPLILPPASSETHSFSDLTTQKTSWLLQGKAEALPCLFEKHGGFIQ